MGNIWEKAGAGKRIYHGAQHKTVPGMKDFLLEEMQNRDYVGSVIRDTYGKN